MLEKSPPSFSYRDNPQVWAMLYVIGPLAFWAIGLFSIYYALSGGTEYFVKAAILLLGLVVGFIWVGLSGYRKQAFSAIYLVVVFGIPLLAACAAFGISYVK